MIACVTTELHQLTGKVEHLSTRADHLSDSLRGLSASIDRVSAAAQLHVGETQKSSGDDALFWATIVVAGATLVVALVPLILDCLSLRRERDAVRRQVEVVLRIVSDRLKRLQENPAYPSTVLGEGLDGYMERSLQTEVGRAFDGDELRTIYDALASALQTIAEAADQQRFVEAKELGLNTTEKSDLRAAVEERVRKSTERSITLMEPTLRIFPGKSPQPSR